MLSLLAASWLAVVPPCSPQDGRPNFVVVVLDDIGVEKLEAYGEYPVEATAPCTPNIDRLAAEGLLFRRAYTDPTCSPTRAQILTGRHGFRTGVGQVIFPDTSTHGLALGETILPELLTGYSSSAIGKWHVASAWDDTLQHPLASGFDFYAGALFNLEDESPFSPDCNAVDPLGYENWLKVSDPLHTGVLWQYCWSTYATTDSADEAVMRIRTMQPPFLLYLAFNSAHSPFEPPPAALTSRGGHCGQRPLSTWPDESDARVETHDLMIEALDTELGRVLAELEQTAPDTYVFLIGDNGTPGEVIDARGPGCRDRERGKGSLYESGTRVPLIVAGPGVVAGECEALVGSTDLFATLAELAGETSTAEDSVSMVPYLFGDATPQRLTVYAEKFAPNQVTPDAPDRYPFAPDLHARMIQDGRHKLIRVTTVEGAELELLYDLREDPCEQKNLRGLIGQQHLHPTQSEAVSAYERLRKELVEMGVYRNRAFSLRPSPY